jgi:glyoxylase-like metal-dependent hydrolase (beta-lactamase superfamily II)
VLPIVKPLSARADVASPSAQRGSGFYSFKIGDFQASVVSDGFGSMPYQPIFAPNASQAEFDSAMKANFMKPIVQGATNALVIDTGKQRILIDTGWGEKHGPTFGDYPQLVSSLQRAGFQPDSIDIVVLSHGHLDHIGGLVTKAAALTYPKATFVFVDAEWNYWTGSQYEGDLQRSPMPDVFKKASLLAGKEILAPIASKCRFVKQDGEIVTGVRYVAAPGHTPSHAMIHISSGNDEFLCFADLVHHPIGMQHPDWMPTFDYDPTLAVKSRKAQLDRAATDRIMAMGYHFPFPALGHVVRYDGAFRWEAADWVW